jgi:hypothetical protein
VWNSVAGEISGFVQHRRSGKDGNENDGNENDKNKNKDGNKIPHYNASEQFFFPGQEVLCEHHGEIWFPRTSRDSLNISQA